MRGRVSGTLLHYVVLLIVISGQEVETIAHHVGGIERGGGYTKGSRVASFLSLNSSPHTD